MLQAEHINSTMVKQMHKAHVSAVASWDTLLMTVGAKKWTVITVGKKGHVEQACRNKKSKDKGSKTRNKSDTVKYKKEK